MPDQTTRRDWPWYGNAKSKIWSPDWSSNFWLPSRLVSISSRRFERSRRDSRKLAVVSNPESVVRSLVMPNQVLTPRRQSRRKSKTNSPHSSGNSARVSSMRGASRRTSQPTLQSTTVSGLKILRPSWLMFILAFPAPGMWSRNWR